MTANMLLGPDFVGKFNNLPDVYKRLMGSSNALSMQHTKPATSNIPILENSDFSTKEKRKYAIIEDLPEDIDFVCLQEVWDKLSSMVLIYKMRKHFGYFLTDICQDLGNSSYPFRCKYYFLDFPFLL